MVLKLFHKRHEVEPRASGEFFDVFLHTENAIQ